MCRVAAKTSPRSMFPLAFVAGWLQGHWWGFISRNYVVWPTCLLMNVFIALKGSHFWFLFKLICSCTCTCIWKEDTCTSKRSILFLSTLCSIWTFLENLRIKSLHMHVQYLQVQTRDVPAPVAQSVECPLRETWGHAFNPGPWHTKVFKNGTSCSSLSTQTYEEELGLVEAVSG